ncbi:hypothetical protein [Arthrobacter sp. MMS24-S77]
MSIEEQINLPSCTVNSSFTDGTRTLHNGRLHDLQWFGPSELHIQGPLEYTVTVTNTAECVFPTPTQTVTPRPTPTPTQTAPPTPSVVPTPTSSPSVTLPTVTRTAVIVGASATPVSGTTENRLAYTGSGGIGWIAGAATLLAGAGGALLISRRRRAH